MDPIIILPVALAVAWAASRKKKTTKKKKTTTSTTTPTTTPTPTTAEPTEQPPPTEEPKGPFDGPGGEEPWRPGGPDVDGPKGPEPFPGPNGGPKDPGLGDPSPIEIYPGTTAAEIDAQDNAAYGLFIGSDCIDAYAGDRWFEDVFLPRARSLVLDNPEAFHAPVAVIWELLVVPQLGEEVDDDSAPAACISMWSEFAYGGFTPSGTFSGWILDPDNSYWDYAEWYQTEFTVLDQMLWDLVYALVSKPELWAVFDRDWPDDRPEGDGDVEFEPTGT